MRMRRNTGRLARWLVASGIALAILASGGAAGAEDAPVRLKAEVDRQSATVGDPITYTLTLSWKSGITIFPPSQEIGLGEFELLGFTASEPTQSGERYTQVFSYTIAIYSVGDHTVPRLEVSYAGTSGQVGTVAAPEIAITVESVLTDEEPSLRPIKDPMTIPPRLSRVLLVLLLGFAVAAGLLYYLLWWRRRPKGAAHEPRDAAPQLSPEEQAYQELEEITGRDLLAQGRVKEHYTLVSEVARRYVGRRFRIYTLERTTSEVLRDLAPLLDDAELFRAISGFLRDSDAVKFAKYVPPQVDQQRLIRRARGIVDTCAPAPQPQPSGEAASPVTPSTPPASASLGRTSP